MRCIWLSLQPDLKKKGSKSSSFTGGRKARGAIAAATVFNRKKQLILQLNLVSIFS
jgi:hypothetical protein